MILHHNVFLCLLKKYHHHELHYHHRQYQWLLRFNMFHSFIRRQLFLGKIWYGGWIPCWFWHPSQTVQGFYFWTWYIRWTTSIFGVVQTFWFVSAISAGTQRLQGKMQLDSTHSFEFFKQVFQTHLKFRDKAEHAQCDVCWKLRGRIRKAKTKNDKHAATQAIFETSLITVAGQTAVLGAAFAFKTFLLASFALFQRSSLSQICEAVCWLWSKTAWIKPSWGCLDLGTKESANGWRRYTGRPCT